MKMKKILAAVLAGVMALSATACSSSSTKKIESPDDFAGAKVSVQTGTTAHDALQKMQEEGVDVEILPYEKITQCFDDVSLGRADAVYVDSVVAAYYTSQTTTLNSRAFGKATKANRWASASRKATQTFWSKPKTPSTRFIITAKSPSSP